jgi:hypothetical protein
MRRGLFTCGLIATALAVISVGLPPAASGQQRDDSPTPIARGWRVSGVTHQAASQAGLAASPAVACSRPGGGNYLTNCHGSGRPVNETWVIRAPSGTYYAGANDYNSYNGQGQNGFYWSGNGTSWSDAGPIDVFPHNANNGGGDPGIAADSSGVVYYSSLFFNFNRCNVGGVELIRGTRNSDGSVSWLGYYQIAANSRSQFQDKPAITVSGSNVFESWTQFGSCSGVNVTSPIKVARFATGANNNAPQETLNVPGSQFSQGSAITPDGSGGFYLAWEEFPSATATIGSIKLAHWNGGTWTSYGSISPSTFEDMPSPLSGFSFRDNSFPAIADSAGTVYVTWCAFDSSKDPSHGAQTQKARCYLDTAANTASASLTKLSDRGGHQFFPAIAADGSGGVYVSYSQENLNADGSSAGSYDAWLVHNAAGTPVKKSTASSQPSQDKFFSGQFIGDYSGIVVDGAGGHPYWTDIRGPDPNYATWEMDGMTAF